MRSSIRFSMIMRRPRGAEVTLGGLGGNGVERFGGEGQLDAFVR